MKPVQKLAVRESDEENDASRSNHQYDIESDISVANLAGANNEKRDLLLLRCRDAIENLHEELQDERTMKH